jgi:tocopherol cyclase
VFSTYHHTKLQVEMADSNTLEIKLETGKQTYLLSVKSIKAGMLKAPVKGSMDRRIPESIDATLEIILLDKKGNQVFMDSSTITGLEMVGDYKKLVERIG